MLHIDFNDLEADDDWGTTYNWQGKLFTGLVYERYPNGQLASVFEMEDSKINGAICEWYPSGKLRMEGYGHEKLSFGYAWVSEWHENGSLKRETLSKFGQRIKEKTWNENGQLISECEQPPEQHLYLPSKRQSRIRSFLKAIGFGH